MPAKRSLLLGAVTNWAAFAATMLVAFFLAPYLIRNLGDARYGVWCVVESILAYFTLFDLGIAACLVRFVAKFHAIAAGADARLWGLLMLLAAGSLSGVFYYLRIVAAMLAPAPPLARTEPRIGLPAAITLAAVTAAVIAYGVYGAAPK